MRQVFPGSESLRVQNGRKISYFFLPLIILAPSEVPMETRSEVVESARETGITIEVFLLNQNVVCKMFVRSRKPLYCNFSPVPHREPSEFMRHRNSPAIHIHKTWKFQVVPALSPFWTMRGFESVAGDHRIQSPRSPY